MKQIRITLLIDIPEGIGTPDVDYSDTPPADLMALAAEVFNAPQEPAHIAETFAPFGGGKPPAAPRCSTHGSEMVRYPAGVNKAGKPYNASWRCAVKDCPTKPLWDREAA